MDWKTFAALEQADYNRVNLKLAYVDMTGDLVTGLLLSQIVYWHLPNKKGEAKLQVQRDGYFWLAKKRSEWWDEIRISPKQVDKAIKKLREMKIIVTAKYKFDTVPVTHIRLNFDVFLELWQAAIGLPSPENTSPDTPENTPPDMSENTKTGKSILPKGQNPSSPKGKMELDQTVTSMDFPQKVKSLTDHILQTETTYRLTTETSDDVPVETPDGVSENDSKPPKFVDPFQYTAREIKADKTLSRQQWGILLQMERKAKKPRKTIIDHCEKMRNAHVLEPVREEMLAAMNRATVQDLDDPNMRGLFNKVLNEQLWPKENYYTPEEVNQFAAECQPVGSVNWLASELSKWRGMRRKGQSPNDKPNGQPTRPTRPNITIPGGHRDYDAEARERYARYLEQRKQRKAGQQSSEPAVP